MKNLFSFLGGKKKPAAATVPSPPPTAPAAPPAADKPVETRWLGKDDPANPFTVDGYDCLAFVTSMLSTTRDPAIAESFMSLRSADGKNLIGQRPEDAVELSCSLAYEFGGEHVDGPLHKASAMEEKWDIYLYAEHVYFCRSWTGTLAFVAEVVFGELELSIARIWASTSTEPDLAVQQVDYLIKHNLYGKRLPHPLPSGLEADAHVIELYSFSQYGRRCCFATFESTLRDPITK